MFEGQAGETVEGGEKKKKKSESEEREMRPPRPLLAGWCSNVSARTLSVLRGN